MTPMRIGASWARTSLPPRPSAATVAAEFLRSDLRDVIVVMNPPVSFAIAGRDAAAFRAVFGQRCLKSTRPSHRTATESGLPHPKSVAHACDEIRLRSSRKPLFGLLIWPHVTKPGGQVGIDPPRPRKKLLHIGLFRLAIGQRERVA